MCRREKLRRWAGLAAGFTLLVITAGCEPPARPVPVASTGPCSAWPNDPADLHSNAEPIGLGCANRLNLRSMLDRPEDLQAGRPLGPANGARHAAVVEDYEKGRVAPLPSTQPGPKIIAPPAPAGQ
jgi:hypothetical protein